MKLTVVIVNYNVQYFLEQCLYSVRKASEGLAVETIVVDNRSVDGSVEMVREKFPEVTLLANQENLGFSKANNQAIRQAKGEHVLLLNPDTLVEEDTFSKVLDFMDQHPDAGGLGVRMLDGKGRFLPESKRGLPTPIVAFYKIFGLAGIFPRSKRFGKYHLGYLSEEETHDIEVLSGAFMLLRKAALDEVGLLDESFFMYGEDIDLSYRITKGGYKNYYFPETRIIHYKGESTKKSSINYVFVFYKAMVIFAQKHFTTQYATLFSLLINVAIWMRAGLAILNRFILRTFLPFLDFAAIFLGLYLIKGEYQDYTGNIYAENIVSLAFGSYSLIWVIMIFFSGGYDKPIKISRVATGTFLGTGIILIAYSLLSEDYRFSRAIILLGTLWALLVTAGIRGLLQLLPFKEFELNKKVRKRFAIVGGEKERERVSELLKKTTISPDFIAPVNPNDASDPERSDFVASLNQLEETIRVFRVNEVIFCTKDLPVKTVISQMIRLGNNHLDYKIAPENSPYIIGSNSLNTMGELYLLEETSLGKSAQVRNKRFLDVALSLVFLALSPILIFTVKKPMGLLANIGQVIAGNKTWVGYAPTQKEAQSLPKLKPGVLNPCDLAATGTKREMAEKLNHLYAKEYQVFNDLEIVRKSWSELGRNKADDSAEEDA